MRIAICLSGQPRSIEFAKSSILKFFNGGHEYDFFCHSWDYNTWKLCNDTFSSKELVDATWLSDQIGAFKPKAYLIQSEDHYLNVQRKAGLAFLQWGSLFYSMMMANHLKRVYETENGFIYDAVVKARYDCVFNPNHTSFLEFLTHMKPGSLFFSHAGRMGLEYNRINASDCLFTGDSHSMDVACDIFRHIIKSPLPKLDDYERVGPGVLLTKYLQDRNIQVYPAHTHAGCFQEVFYRKEMLGLDAITDYPKIEQFHNSFYRKQ